MRSITAITVVIALLGASGCLRPGPGRSGNIAIIAVGGTLMAGTLVKSQFSDSSSGGGINVAPIFEGGFLFTFFILGLATTTSGIIGLTMKPQ